MIEYIVKKFVVGKINGALKNWENLDTLKDTLSKWVSRLEKILGAVKSLLEKLSDNEINETEIKALGREISELVKSW